MITLVSLLFITMIPIDCKIPYTCNTYSRQVSQLFSKLCRLRVLVHADVRIMKYALSWKVCYVLHI